MLSSSNYILHNKETIILLSIIVNNINIFMPLFKGTFPMEKFFHSEP